MESLDCETASYAFGHNAQANRVRVVLISSGEIGWTDLRETLRMLPTARVVAEFSWPQVALNSLIAAEPDVIISAARIGPHSVLRHLTEARQRLGPRTKIVVASTHFDPVESNALLSLTVSGLLLWGDLTRQALRDVMSLVIESSIVAMSKGIGWSAIGMSGAPDRAGALSILSDRERVVLNLLTQGLSRAEISQREGISRRSTERAIASLQTKLDASSPFILGLRAAQHGLVDSPPLRLG